MILDSLKNSALYNGVHPRLMRAFEYLTALDLNALKTGRHEIDGEEIFMNVTESELKRPEEAPLETHDKYIDIQVLVSGDAETMGWSERRDCLVPRGAFDEQKDIRFYDDVPQTFFEVRQGQFVVFMPEDAHAPMIGRGPIKKIIVKVMK